MAFQFCLQKAVREMFNNDAFVFQRLNRFMDVNAFCLWKEEAHRRGTCYMLNMNNVFFLVFSEPFQNLGRIGSGDFRIAQLHLSIWKIVFLNIDKYQSYAHFSTPFIVFPTRSSYTDSIFLAIG